MLVKYQNVIQLLETIYQKDLYLWKNEFYEKYSDLAPLPHIKDTNILSVEKRKEAFDIFRKLSS